MELNKRKITRPSRAKKEIWKKYNDELKGIDGVKLFNHNLKIQALVY